MIQLPRTLRYLLWMDRPEIQGKKVEENDLVLGIRYWICSRKSPSNTFTISGIFDGRFRNTIRVNMLRFKHSYYLRKNYSCDDITVFRYWYPLSPIYDYYEIRALSREQTKEIQTYARRLFELRIAKRLQEATCLPADIVFYIAQFSKM